MLKTNIKDRQNTKEKFLFKTRLNNRKRGRKAIKQLGVKKYPEYTSLSNDNITRKIQIHFLTFLISFINPFDRPGSLSFSMNTESITASSLKQVQRGALKILF